MSIYNGFGTRAQEASYNKALYNVTFLMQFKIVKFLKGGTLRPSQRRSSP